MFVQSSKLRRCSPKRKSGLDIDEMRVKSMIYLITHAETKSEALTAYCDWFRVAERTGREVLSKDSYRESLKRSDSYREGKRS